MKDYYQILGVTETTSEEDIRRRYRKLAMRYHPDRNPDDPEAEDKFKEIAEAYGVLTDPVKRQAYARARAMGSEWRDTGSGNGFTYSQEDILRDLFRDPRFQRVFQGLLREFQNAGFRASPQFVRKSFFGGRGGLFFGGLFVVGSLVGPALLRSAGKHLPDKNRLFHSLGTAVGRLLQAVKSPDRQDDGKKRDSGVDVTYVTPLSARELRDGKMVQVVTEGPDGQEMLKVAIPPDSRAGQLLRLRGRGRATEDGRGDLYLHLQERDE